eukprot:GHVN01094908.1.p1 GENE.GHVN01094908.1~~GHVN01094908.1.p1  ORF type:complete len:229 (-),score=39.50 GHVN01094908.1:192-878(-)
MSSSEWEVFHMDNNDGGETTIVVFDSLCISCPRRVSVHITQGNSSDWLNCPTHRDVIFIGPHDTEFSDCFVCYTRSSPKTHIFAKGNTIHIDEKVVVSFTPSTTALTLHQNIRPQEATRSPRECSDHGATPTSPHGTHSAQQRSNQPKYTQLHHGYLPMPSPSSGPHPHTVNTTLPAGGGFVSERVGDISNLSQGPFTPPFEIPATHYAKEAIVHVHRPPPWASTLVQ